MKQTHFIHERCFGACGSVGPVPLLQALSLSQLDPLTGFLSLAFTTPGALGLTFHDFDRVSRSPSSTCTASPPAAASFRSLCTFRACRSVKSVPSLASTDVKASRSARGFDIHMQSRQESASPFQFPSRALSHPALASAVRFPGRG